MIGAQALTAIDDPLRLPPLTPRQQYRFANDVYFFLDSGGILVTLNVPLQYAMAHAVAFLGNICS